MEKKEYDKYKHFNVSDKTVFKNELSKLIVSNSKITNSKINIFKLPIHNPSAFKILFTYLNPNNTIPNASTQYGYINSFFNGFNDMINTKSYDDVLNHIVDSIDVFGLGFTLQFMANCFKRLNALSLQDFTRLSAFFYKMYDFNPLTRVVDIDLLLNEYENILLELGILMRLKKSFKNHTLVNKLFAPSIIISKSKSDNNTKLHIKTNKYNKTNKNNKKTTKNKTSKKF
jgi:hypothetical protein